MDTDSLFVGEASMLIGVLVDKVQRVAGEIVGMAADLAFYKVSIMVSYRNQSAKALMGRRTGVPHESSPRSSLMIYLGGSPSWNVVVSFEILWDWI